MQPRTRALVAAATLGSVAAVLFWIGEPAPGAAMAAAAAAVGLLVTERSTSRDRPGEAADGAVASLARLSEALNLEGQAVMVPLGEGVEGLRCFVPARPAAADELPPFDEDTAIYREPVGVLGVSIHPTGRGLLRSWARERDPPVGGGVEAALQHLSRSLPHLEIGDDVTVERADDRVRVTYRPTMFADLCAWTRADDRPWGRQGMCPACSFVHGIVTLAVDRPVAVEGIGEVDGRVRIEMEVGPSLGA